MTDQSASRTADDPGRLRGWLEAGAIVVPAVIAGLTNAALIVVSIVHRDDTVIVVSAIGVVVVTVVGIAAESTRRAAFGVSQRLAALEAVTNSQSSNAASEQGAARGALKDVAAALDTVEQNVAALIRQSRVISREDFYEAAIRLVANPPSRESTVRVFNLFGYPPSQPGTDAQSRWFALVATFDENGPPINFRRIKLVPDERSMRWTLETLLRNLGRRNFNMAVLAGDSRSLAYPLNAHCYYRSDAFILLPGHSPAVSDPDGAVIHIRNPPEVEVLAHYHDNLFSSCDARCEQGRVNPLEWRHFVEDNSFASPTVDRLLADLERGSDG